MNSILTFFCINKKAHIGNNSLKPIILTITLALLLYAPNTFSQNTTITFYTKENVTFNIGKEVDDTYTRTLTNQITIDTTGTYTYNWDVHNFQFVECFFHDGGSTFFPIKEGSNLTITYKGDNKIEVAGADKSEVEYYTNGYKDITRPFIGALFSLPAESSFVDLSLLIEKYDSVLSNTLDSLVSENTISPQFSEIVTNTQRMITTCISIEIFRTKYLENAATKVNGQDSIKVEQLIDAILNKISPLIDSGDIWKYSLGKSAVTIFYNNKYRHLNEKKKEELLSSKLWAKHLDPQMLGYLVAPKEIQYKLLSLKLLDNYKKVETKGNSIFLNHIIENCPRSAFLPYLEEEQRKLLASMNTDHSEVKYIEDTISTLEDLCKVDVFDQKILYIDLWATWCGPCIAEFKHKDKLHELLANYTNIVPVYISIDDDKNDKVWKEKTKAFNLKGYHLRANKELVTDINKSLYEGKGIGVPHYILMDKNGNILEKNLTRPSNIDKLKLELDKHFD